MTTAADAIPSQEVTPRRRTVGELMREPVLGPLLASRFCSVGCSVIGLTQVWSALAGVTIWTCPVPRFIGIPCPGCGLSRAAGAMFHGHFDQMLHQHAFAPFFIIALAAFMVASVLPTRSRDRFAAFVTAGERTLPVAPTLLLLLILYWLARLIALLV